jgi:gliding motility-associatede transport system auxiliary component
MRRPALVVAVQVAVVVAILACVLTLSVLHPRRLDLTPEHHFTLSAYTRDIIARLRDDVRISLFYSSQAGPLRHEMTDLLGLYREAQPRIDVHVYDLDRNPGIAKRLGVGAYNTAVVEAGERREQVEVVTEDGVTAALLRVAGTPPVATYFVVGHGERDPRDDDPRTGASDLARALASEGFEVEALEGAAELPADAGLVVLAGPTRDLRPPEVDALAAYVTGGGNLLVLADPDTPAGVAALVRRFGVEVARDLVVDERGRLFGTDGRSARVAYLNEGLVAEPPDVRALLPEAQSLRLLDAPGVRADYLAMTAESSWADVDRRAPDSAPTFRPGRDHQGPLPVAVFARVTAPGGREGRLVVIGDADFVSNLHLNVLGNRDLLLTAAELVARADPLAASRPAAAPGGTFSPLTLTAREARLVFWGVVVAPTFALAAVALGLARRRRFA